MEFLKPISETFALLMSPQNVGGLWAVITALVALLGIFIKNFFEEKRKIKERQKVLIKDAYLGAAKYLAYMYYQLLKIGTSQNLNADTEIIANTAKFYNLTLVGTPKIVGLVAKAAITYSNFIAEIGKKKLELDIVNNDIKIAEPIRDMALKKMQEYNENEINSPELFETYSLEFDKYHEEIAQLSRKQSRLSSEILKETFQSTVSIAPLVYEALVEMREDLELKLEKKHRVEMNSTIETIISEMKVNSEKFIEIFDEALNETEES